MNVAASSLSDSSDDFSLDLGGQWNLVILRKVCCSSLLAQVNSNGTVKAVGTVPGDIVTDLQAAGIIGDPYYGYNDVLYRWIGLDNWTYSRSFTVEAGLLTNTRVLF
jgi:beta-galactosidase/beta-glucuronidase